MKEINCYGCNFHKECDDKVVRQVENRERIVFICRETTQELTQRLHQKINEAEALKEER